MQVSFVPLLKNLGGLFFGLFDGDAPDPNAKLYERFDALEKQIKTTEQNLKDNTYNVVQLANIGEKFNSVSEKYQTLLTRIGNITKNQNFNAAQKLEKIANLYDTDLFMNLESAMNGATNCFFSDNNDIFETQNIFDATYNRACEEVMFSGEALDLSTPYLFRQLGTYLIAYVIMNEVYDAYDQVYGAGSTQESKALMNKRITGCDADGNKIESSLIDLYHKYYSRDRFTFVGKSNPTSIKLKSYQLWYTELRNVWARKYKVATPDGIRNNALSAQQTRDLADYCAAKKITIAQLLFDRVGFKGASYEDYVAYDSKLHMPAPFFPIPGDYTKNEPVDPRKAGVPDCNLYLATGPQSYECGDNWLRTHSEDRDSWMYLHLINAKKVGAGDEHFRVFYQKNSWTEPEIYNIALLYFEKA